MSDAARAYVVRGADGRSRCWWPGDAADYVAYHDDEWGRPVDDDRRLFEKLCLEGFQSGLSWLTILRKRDAFRRAFAGFDPVAVAAFGPADVERLLGDRGIVRHRGKIEAAIANARRCVELLEDEPSLATYVWSFEPAVDERARPEPSGHPSGVPSTSPASVRLAKDLKRRGWRFVGPTTVYAFFQAMGLVNDHVAGCEWRAVCDDARAAFVRPLSGQP